MRPYERIWGEKAAAPPAKAGDFPHELKEESYMDIREAIKERHSVRQYRPDPIPDDLVEELGEHIRICNAESGLHMQLILDDPECFNTLLGHYGKFENANNYIVSCCVENY